jgi:hypothetical protein
MNPWALAALAFVSAVAIAYLFDWLDLRSGLASACDNQTGWSEDDALAAGPQIAQGLPGERWLLWHEGSAEPYYVVGDMADVVEVTRYLSWLDQLEEVA